jgi:predicted HTH transcriptional regulator
MAKSSRDQTVFIEAFLYTLSLSGLSIENQINDLLNTKVKKHNKLKTKFNERQIQILDFLDVEKKVTRKKYTKMMGVSFMTSYRDLQELLDEGYIKQEGLGRGTFYTLPKREDVIERDEIMVIGD